MSSKCLSVLNLKVGKGCLFCVRVAIHQELARKCAVVGQSREDGPGSPRGLGGEEPGLPAQLPTCLPSSAEVLGMGAPGGLGAELQMSSLGWPLSARVMH